MDEFELLYGEEFFVIDSNNLDTVKQRLYGYSMQNGEIVENDTIDNNGKLEGDGAYVWVKVDENSIKIYQDFLGSYGIYLYEKDNYFAISNSFIKLLDYLKDSENLSFNKEYADAFLFSDYVTYAYGETLVKEIEVLPRNYEFIIDKASKSIEYVKLDFEERSVSITSQEGLEILDKWHEKWVTIIRSIKNKSNNITCGLSGGMDTRMLATIWLTSNIDLNKINIKSFTDINHQTDLEVANRIANEFNFKLNENEGLVNQIPFKEINTTLKASFYPKLGFHKEMYFGYGKYEEPVFLFGGDGGETIRGYYDATPEEYLEECLEYVSKFNGELCESTKRIVESSLIKAKNNFNIPEDDPKEIPDRVCMEVMARNHYGKSTVEAHLFNIIRLMPLNDPLLHKLQIIDDKCDDRDLLVSIMYDRYCSKLLDFNFVGIYNSTREIRPETIEYAKSINNKYPFVNDDLSFISGPELKEKENINHEGDHVRFDQAYDLIREVLNSKAFESEFNKYYPPKNYYEIKQFADNSTFFPLKQMCAAIAILKAIYSTKSIIPKDSNNYGFFLESFLNKTEFKELMNPDTLMLLLKYATARIDIKNLGSIENNIEIIENNDDYSKVYRHGWFKDDNGEGVVIESTSESIDLKIRCVNNGKLTLWLRGLDILDKNGKRFPVFIDYTNLKINNETIFEEHKLISHDTPFIFEKEVLDSEIFDIHIEWSPFSNLSTYE